MIAMSASNRWVCRLGQLKPGIAVSDQLVDAGDHPAGSGSPRLYGDRMVGPTEMKRGGTDGPVGRSPKLTLGELGRWIGRTESIWAEGQAKVRCGVYVYEHYGEPYFASSGVRPAAR